MQNKKMCFKICEDCQGLGKKKRRIKKSLKHRYQSELENYNQSNHKSLAPTPPIAHSLVCPSCLGSGLIKSDHFPIPDHENLPHVAIIGGGIGGVALAVACTHRGIPFTIYERDDSFNKRSQGYALTLQQASKAIEGFGIFNLKDGVVSTRHLVHKTDGTVIAEWGMRKWLPNSKKQWAKKTNIHISRQALRFALIKQLGNENIIKWGHQFINFKKNTDGELELNFSVEGNVKTEKANIIVGADGIRSAVRDQIFGEKANSLRYLNCIVILGICKLDALENPTHSLLDSATVFQTANGIERIFMMPFDSTSIMWQLSFPMIEKDAITLCKKGAKTLKDKAIKRTNWHTPIPEIINASSLDKISGYPVYDRELLSKNQLEKLGNVTLIGDAAHPMSPFKGQGANQALLDALSLVREISKKCKSPFHWKTIGIRKNILNDYETEMLNRSSMKVKDSAAAAEFLHSEIALYEANEPRGKVLKRK